MHMGKMFLLYMFCFLRRFILVFIAITFPQLSGRSFPTSVGVLPIRLHW